MFLGTKEQTLNLLRTWSDAAGLPAKRGERTIIAFPYGGQFDARLVVVSKTRAKATYGGPLYAVTYHMDEMAALDEHAEQLARLPRLAP